ncbi:hypothetical protein P3T76_006901 [Phytophthora citrophthora]|uniref:Uncharacterized protein n=1 Tax=Phytophthora citrophthora TaxID=4793 RepID=A0AAD9GNH7_9STRA|nr:hypothetical protein P3T76_006901 [Phytophthora citrophthora]
MISVELEHKLVKTCEEGDIEACKQSVVDLQLRYGLATESVQELLGYAFSCAAAHNQVEIMALLLSKDSRECLWYGMCRYERYFPRRPRFQCCYALRYLAFAAVVCVEQNTLQALEFLIQKQTPPIPQLLVDSDVVRCFRYALELRSDFNAPAPEVYRPMLMLLLRRYSILLLPHVDGKQDEDESVEFITRQRMDALRSSLKYEYVTNPQLQTKY